MILGSTLGYVKLLVVPKSLAGWKWEELALNGVHRYQVVMDTIVRGEACYASAVLKGWPLHVFQHFRDTGSIAISILHEAGSTPLHGFDTVDVLLGMGIPNA